MAGFSWPIGVRGYLLLCSHPVHTLLIAPSLLPFNYPFRECHLFLKGTLFTTNALQVSKKSINKLGFGYRVFIRSGCSSLVSFVAAPAGTRGITVSEHLTLQSNCYMSSCFMCSGVDGHSLTHHCLAVSPASLRILPTRPPAGVQIHAILPCPYGGWDLNSDSPVSVASTYNRGVSPGVSA